MRIPTLVLSLLTVAALAAAPSLPAQDVPVSKRDAAKQWSDDGLARVTVKGLDAVYARLDRMRATANRRLSDTLRESADTPQALSERESYERLYVEDLAKFDAAEQSAVAKWNAMMRRSK